MRTLERAAADQFANTPERRRSGVSMLHNLPPIDSPPAMRMRSLREDGMQRQLVQAQDQVRELQIAVDAYKKDAQVAAKTIDEYESKWDALQEERDAAASNALSSQQHNAALQKEISDLKRENVLRVLNHRWN
ncbi:hypothetical protein E8E13_009300 [Curvularia kusanoi]|uniref:Uncharacterized protein n=1 Tax=Curvularia kusanoi TaxID=90978 RepID=A0A9P4TL40_CURKU|nr:hypothetical protein E8E13_009300 [Curvularia kusanoi]